MEFAARLRAAITSVGWKDAEVARRANMSTSALSRYTNGQSFPNSEQLFPLCDALSIDPRWLINGTVPPRASALADAQDAEWESVPFFDLREMSDTGKGEPQSWTPFRKDWLNRTLGTSFDLYLVRLLSDYRSRTGDRDLLEGDLVFCREIEPVELVDGYVCIFRRDQGLKVARYSLRPAERVDEDVITSAEIGDDLFVPVARILGKFLQRL